MSFDRLKNCFAKCQAEKRTALGIFITAGDPNPAISEELLLGLPDAGADFVELGMPFSDPMADGPVIQAASLRAIKAGMTSGGVLQLAVRFRARHADVPLILMGYYNPIYVYGVERFLTDAHKAGVDGLIIVDLPPEEDAELCLPARQKGLDFIRLITPTTDAARLPKTIDNASGFIYYVSITGITGTASASTDSISQAVTRIRQASTLPVVVGFGIKTPQDVRAVGQHADGVVIGSAIVSIIGEGGDANAARAQVKQLATATAKEA